MSVEELCNIDLFGDSTDTRDEKSEGLERFSK